MSLCGSMTGTFNSVAPYEVFSVHDPDKYGKVIINWTDFNNTDGYV